jgi:hypothetical protein
VYTQLLPLPKYGSRIQCRWHVTSSSVVGDFWIFQEKQSTVSSVTVCTPQTTIPKLCEVLFRRLLCTSTKKYVDCVWNVMAHAQKPDFLFRRNGRVHLNQRGRQFSRLLAAEACASAVVMLDTPCSEVVWRVLATHSILQLPLHFPYRASPCAITFQLDSTTEISVSIRAALITLWSFTAVIKHDFTLTGT